jgi:hypothetical protein
MSIDEPNRWDDEPDEQKEVIDDGEVDRKVKDRILKARETVDEAETQLFVERYDEIVANSPRGTPKQEIDQNLSDRWGVVVRQYIRTIRPLLKSGDIEQAEYYWKEVPLFEQEIPPAPQDGVDWPRFYRIDARDYDIAREMGLDVGMGFEAPEPKDVSVNGLRELLDFQPRTLYWSVDLNPDAIPPNRDTATLTNEFTIQKGTYEMAVEYADEFLQQAGIGLEIGSGDPHGKT